MKTVCSGSSLRTPRTKVFPTPKVKAAVIYDVASAGGMATLFATEYGLYALEHNGVCSANPIGWEPIYVATTGSAVSGYQSSYDIKRLAVQPICADDVHASRPTRTVCTLDLPSSLTPMTMTTMHWSRQEKFSTLGAGAVVLRLLRSRLQPFQSVSSFNVVPLEDSHSVWLLAVEKCAGSMQRQVACR